MVATAVLSGAAGQGCAWHRPKRFIPTNLGQLTQSKRSRRPSLKACDAQNLGHDRPHAVGFPIRGVGGGYDRGLSALTLTATDIDATNMIAITLNGNALPRFGDVKLVANAKTIEQNLNTVDYKSAVMVGRSIEANHKPLSSRGKTLTVNNGKEFAHHQAIDQALGMRTYFADPYCSRQCGTNDNFDGLLRQYVPKKRRMETLTDEELAMIQNRLNHRPRKRLGFKTPNEVVHASLNRVALRA